MDMDNLILLTDSYKVTHAKQYPPNCTNVYSYFESRGGDFQETVFFGLQYILKKYLSTPIRSFDIEEAKEICALHFGNDKLFNEEGWRYIVDKYDGKLPVSIKAVPEGTKVPVSNVLMTIENTDLNCWWLTNYIETLLVQTWYPTTIATLSNYYRRMILRYLEETGDPSTIDFKLHDFGFRGSTSVESSGIGGCAHLVNFKGTDTMSALLVARDYYACKMAGFSIPAAEHSTITSWGREHEVDAYRNMLKQFPTGLVACVSDSFNIYRACSELWGMTLKDEVLARNGILVIRPDSGKPRDVVPDVIKRLGKAFGWEKNSKGYYVLNPKVRVIQGDGINLRSCEGILEAMKYDGLSADNIAFGSGGGLLQQVNRDTCRFAFKCSSVVVDGEETEVYKEPFTDPKKNSKRGRLKLISAGGHYITLPCYGGRNEDVLQEVFRNGDILVNWKLDEIRKRATKGQ